LGEENWNVFEKRRTFDGNGIFSTQKFLLIFAFIEGMYSFTHKGVLGNFWREDFSQDTKAPSFNFPNEYIISKNYFSNLYLLH
jgi:hypothetical protein